MPDERATMNQVGEYWDALILGDIAEAVDLDPELATTIERLQNLGARPAAEARRRVWSDVLSSLESDTLPKGDPWLHAVLPGGDAPVAVLGGRGRDAPPGRARWALAHLATAALILLTLVSSYIAFGPGRPARHEKPGLAPRIYHTPSAPDLHLDQPAAAWVWETEGGPGRPIGSAGFLAIDPDGNLWVADNERLEFQIFAPDGRYLEAWRPPGIDRQSSSIHERIAVAFDRDGNLYVVSSGDQTVRKYADDRSLLLEWGGTGSGDGQFLSPSSIAADSRGGVYVLDNRRSDVQVFDDRGTYLATIGRFGIGDGQFVLTEGGAVAVDGANNLWVADAGNHRLQKFSPDRRFLTSLGKYGPGKEDLNDPGQLAFDSAGRVFVSAPHSQHVNVFDPDGSFLAAWGVAGDHPGEFFATTGIAVDGKGYAYVSDGDDRVQKFLLKSPLTTATANANSATGTTGEVATLLWEAHGGPDLPLYRPGHVAVDPVGNIWVVDGSRNAFQIFSPEGDYLESWGGPGSAEGEFSFFDPVIMVTTGAAAFDQSGNIYVADAGNHRVQKFGPDREFIAAWGARGTGDGELLTPTHVTLDDRGFVYVTDGERHDVQVFDSNGAYVRTIGEYGSGEGQLIISLDGATAVDGNDSIWVADRSNHRIQQFAPDGTFLAAVGGYGFGDGKFSSPNDVIIDSEGRIFVGDVGRTGVRVQVFAPDGEFIAGWSDSEGSSAGGANLALDHAGHIYVSDYNGDRILKYALNLH